MATKTTQGATGSNVLLEDLENPESDLPKMADSNDMVPMDQTLSKAAIVDNQENQPHPIGSSNSAEPSEELEDNGFVVLNNDATNTPSDADRNRTDLYHELEKQLQDQISRCKNYMEIFTQAHGDMTKVSQFRTFSEIAQKNLDLLRFRWKNGDKFPLVKHETFNFLIIPTNTELGSNDLSVEFVRGINLKVSERSYTYMKLEFPYPQEKKPTAKIYARQSSNPIYDQTVKFPIERESRAFQRVIKRKTIEVSLYKKEKFWRCDTKLGTFSIKLTDLANQCTLHECYSVMNGRRPTDSKVETIVKIRQALFNKEPIKVEERWLVFAE